MNVWAYHDIRQKPNYSDMPSAKYDGKVSLISRDWWYRHRGPLNADLEIMHGTNLSDMHKYYNLTANVKLYSAVSLSSW